MKSSSSLLRRIIPNSVSWCIAGGAALGDDKHNDVDCYFQSEDDLQTVLDILSTRLGMYSTVTPNTYTYQHTDYYPIQLIRTIYGDPHAILSSFDLSCCKKAILPDGSVYTHPDYSPEIAIPNVENIRTSTISRIGKYFYQKEYPFNVSSLQALFTHLANHPDLIIPSGYNEQQDRPAGDILLNIIPKYRCYDADLFPLVSHLETSHPEYFV